MYYVEGTFVAEEETDSKDDCGKHQRCHRSQSTGGAGPVQKESFSVNHQEIQPYSSQQLTARLPGCPISHNILEETDLSVKNNCKLLLVLCHREIPEMLLALSVSLMCV